MEILLAIWIILGIIGCIWAIRIDGYIAVRDLPIILLCLFMGPLVIGIILYELNKHKFNLDYKIWERKQK